MKKIFTLFLAFTLTLSCRNAEASPENQPTNTGVNYEFTIIIDNKTYKVKGNTANDAGFIGPISNLCTATYASEINLEIKDVTYKNYVQGNPIRCSIAAPLAKGTNNMQVYISGMPSLYYKYNANPGLGGQSNVFPFTFTDLGTPSTGTLGTPSYVYGKPVKGYFNGTVYKIPNGSSYATAPVNISINFTAVRLY